MGINRDIRVIRGKSKTNELARNFANNTNLGSVEFVTFGSFVAKVLLAGVTNLTSI